MIITKKKDNKKKNVKILIISKFFKIITLINHLIKINKTLIINKKTILLLDNILII
jgi:hypothetical protein